LEQLFSINHAQRAQAAANQRVVCHTLAHAFAELYASFSIFLKSPLKALLQAFWMELATARAQGAFVSMTAVHSSQRQDNWTCAPQIPA
jgi:hypothetical protein